MAQLNTTINKLTRQMKRLEEEKGHHTKRTPMTPLSTKN